MEARIWHKAYEQGVPPSIQFEDLTLAEILGRAAQRYPDNPAVIFMNCRMTYRRLQEEVDRLATALAGMGIGKGGRVAVHLPNLPQTVIAFHAVQRLGAQAVMTNPLYVPREIEHQWNDAQTTVAVTTDFLYERHLRGLRGKLPVKHYIIASIPEYLGFPLNLLAPLKLKKMDPPSYAKVAPEAGLHFFRKLVRATPPNPPAVKVGMDDVAMLQYTGGTTGVSKGAQLTQRNIGYNLQQIQAWFTSCEPGKEVLLAALPFFHIFGLTVCMNWPLWAGAAMVLMPNPRDIPHMIKNIEKERVTLFPAVPAMFVAINQFPNIEQRDLKSIKSCFSGSAPLSVDVLERFEKLTGSKIVEGFGMTETSPVTHCNPLLGKRKVGKVGVPVSDTDARVVSVEDGATELPVGREGELIVRGPQVMKGYWNVPDETAKLIKDGWIYTGDLAVMDEEGYFQIVGRKKDMIIAGGYNVYPDEIDRVLMGHPGVLEACTIGVPDPRRGETVKSFVVAKPGQQLTEQQVIEFCKERLAAYKVPKSIEFRGELPKSSMMKLLRRELRAQEEKKMVQAQAHARA